MVNRNFKKVIALLSVLAMAATFVPMVAFAASTVSLDTVEFVADTDSAIHVKGTLAGGGSLKDSGDITLLVVRSDKSLAELNNQIPELSGNDDIILFVDQKADNREQNGEIVECTAEWAQIILRETDATGDYILVFMGGSEAEAFQCAELTKSTPAESVTVPMAALEEGKDYYVDGAQVLDFTDVPQAWLDGVTITVVPNSGEDEVEEGSISTLTGNISMNEAPDEVTTYTIKFSHVDGYVDVADKTVKVISADGEKLMNYEGTAAWISNDAEADEWTISIPASTEDVVITVQKFVGSAEEGTDVTADVAESVLTVARAENGGDAQTIKVIATAGDASKVLGTFFVPAKGATATAISADDVNFVVSADKNAFSKFKGNGYAIVTIEKGTLDYTTQSIKLGGTVLFYNPQNEYFIGIVTGYADADAVASAAQILDEASDTMYYGKTQLTYTDETIETILSPDFGVVKRIVLNKETAPKDKQLLASDVGGGKHDGQVTSPDFGALKRVVLKKDPKLAIIKD